MTDMNTLNKLKKAAAKKKYKPRTPSRDVKTQHAQAAAQARKDKQDKAAAARRKSASARSRNRAI